MDVKILLPEELHNPLDEIQESLKPLNSHSWKDWQSRRAQHKAMTHRIWRQFANLPLGSMALSKIDTFIFEGKKFSLVSEKLENA